MNRWDIFYDECKADGYWHCFLFVPKSKVSDLFELISKARESSIFNDTIHYKKISKKTKGETPRIEFVKLLMEILLYIIQQQKIDATIAFKGQETIKHYEKLGAKIAVFRDLNNESRRESHQKRVEATFRMGLKGALHYLFHKENPIIDKIYVDYDDESFQGSFDELNMWQRLQKDELRSHISYTQDSRIVPFGKSQYSSDPVIANIMQFVDVVLGSMRNVVIQDYDFAARYKTSEILRPILKRNNEGYARMMNSRYCKGFVLTDAYIEDGEWQFKRIEIESDCDQLEIF